MRLKRIAFEHLPLQSAQTFVFDPGYNEFTLRHGLRPEDFVRAVASTLFPPPDDIPGLRFCRLELEAPAGKAALSAEFNGPNVAADPAAAAILEGTVVRARPVITDLLFCGLGKLADGKRARLKEHPQMRRLESLRRELETYRAIDELNENLDRAHHRVFEIHELLKKFREPKKRLAQIAAEYDDVRRVEAVQVSDALVAALKVHDKAEERHGEELYAFQEAIEEAQQHADLHEHAPWYRQVEAWIGATLGVAAFVAAAFLRQNVWAFYAGLLVSGLSCLLVLWAVIKAQRQDEKYLVLRMALRDAQQKKAAAVKKRELDTLPVRRVLEAAGTPDAAEVLEMLAKARALRAERAEVEKRIEALSMTGSPKDLENELALQEGAAKEIERRLAAMPPLASEIHSIEIEIENLEKLLGVDASMLFEGRENQSPLVENLLELASLAIGVDRAKLLPVLIKGIEKNIMPITHGAVSGMVREESGWLFQSGSRFSPLQEFNDVQKQAIIFAIQFTLWQMMAHRFTFLCFVDATSVLHPSLRKTVLHASRHLAQKAQVVVLD